MKRVLTALLAICLLLTGCSAKKTQALCLVNASGDHWQAGFGVCEIALPDEELYIAGYHNGRRAAGVLDACQARAVWLDTGGDGVLLIAVDCVALPLSVTETIRSRLADLPACVNVIATHTHAGADTLGLWGPVAVDGKSSAYMEAVMDAAVTAARLAMADRQAGQLYFGQVRTEHLLEDSRLPHVYDENLYQLRFAPFEGGAGVRVLLYGAHAESLRSQNYLLSRDFPGVLCDQVEVQSGDRTMFLPGAVGGLIMTRELVDARIYPVKNMELTGQRLADYALSIQEETICEPALSLARSVFSVPLDNTVFLYYRFLGILDNAAAPAESATGYSLTSELSVLRLGHVTLALVPGEIFPELVWGGEAGKANAQGVNPPVLADIASSFGMEKLLVIGLANDELGYIIPPSDFLVNKKTPYLDDIRDATGENHYEETNSVGPGCAQTVAEALEAAFRALE